MTSHQQTGGAAWAANEYGQPPYDQAQGICLDPRVLYEQQQQQQQKHHSWAEVPYGTNTSTAQQHGDSHIASQRLAGHQMYDEMSDVAETGSGGDSVDDYSRSIGHRTKPDAEWIKRTIERRAEKHVKRQQKDERKRWKASSISAKRSKEHHKKKARKEIDKVVAILPGHHHGGGYPVDNKRHAMPHQ